jgi:hydroxyacylglutathione hydrolase
MILKPYYLACLAHASYLVGDESTKTAAVVDPQRDVDAYLADAEKLGLKIAHVLLTHFHADFASGHLELAARCGATIHVGAAGETEYAAHALRDGDTLEFGKVRLQALSTPGHTPESTTYALYDLAKSATSPHAIFTGDTLFIGDIGRPDLLVSIGMTAEQLASLAYDSLRNKLLPLPDETIVYPAHGAGSACGKNLSKETSSPLGVQKRVNWALQEMSREDFVRELTREQPTAPAYFAFDAQLNRKTKPTLDAALARGLTPLSLEDVLRRQNAGAVVLDTREPDEYAPRHLAGSTNIGLSGKYANWAGELLRPDQELVLIAAPGAERESITRLGRIGFDRVVGYLEGGAAAFASRPELVRGHRRIDAPELSARLARPDAPLVVDVRASTEWDKGHIAGARNEPLPGLRELARNLPRDRELVIQCQGGYRSSIACSLLEQAGFTRLLDLRGGWNAWSAHTEVNSPS